MARKLIRSALAAALGLAAIALPSTAQAQASPSAYTSATRYDAAGRVTGTISPDPDGVGTGNPFLATRNTYDARGNLIKVETGTLSTWKSELPADAPVNWGAAFTIYTTAETTYDALNRKLTDRVKGSDLVTVSLTQYSYDTLGRLQCTAVRMNPAAYGSLPSSACTLGTEGSHGPDRISKNVYDAAGQLLQVRSAVGTTLESAEVTYTYTNNGKQKFVIDANGNKAELRYDGHDRQVRWVFPSTTKPSSFNDSTPANAVATAGALNESDYELYGYDANGNRTSLRKRDGSTLTYTYDNLNRMTVKVVPERSGLAATHTRDVYYEYDLRGLQTKARFDSLSGEGITTAYDGFGRKTSETQSMDGVTRSLTSGYDKDGNRTSLVYPDNVAIAYTFDGLNRELTGSVVGHSSVAFGNFYYAQGQLYQPWRGPAAIQLGYDNAARLNSLNINLAGTAFDHYHLLTRNPAAQIASRTASNDSYAWGGHINVSRGYTTNGLNQYTAATGTTFTYDANGSLTSDGANTFLYDVENRLVWRGNGSGTTLAGLRYDPLGRLYELYGSAAGANTGYTRLLYDGDALAAEYSTSGTLLRRYVHGSNAGADDDPVIWFESPYVANGYQRYLFTDERGSIVAVTDSTGAAIAINAYDEYGIPAAGNVGRFQYTGQAWLPELGMYYYKARIYSPTLGRFLQTDPIGYEDQYNLYAYVGNDPVNGVDPTGEQCSAPRGGTACPSAVATGATAVTAVAAREGIGAERARSQYKEAVSKLAPNDSEGRSAAKAEARAATPPITRGAVEGTRPGLGPQPGSGGTANRTSAGADRLAGGLGTAGRAAGAAGVAVGAYRIATSDTPGQEAAKVGGGIAGALAGAEAGATVGALAGPWGAVAGGIVGGVAGGFAGEAVVQELLD